MTPDFAVSYSTPLENTREHSRLWIATFAAFIARGWGSRDAMIATDRAVKMIREADEEMPANIEIDELIRTMCEDPGAIETRALGSDMVWAFVPRQVDVDDWDEHGVVLTCKRFDALMATYAGIDATAPDDDEVPA